MHKVNNINYVNHSISRMLNLIVGTNGVKLGGYPTDGILLDSQTRSRVGPKWGSVKKNRNKSQFDPRCSSWVVSDARVGGPLRKMKK